MFIDRLGKALSAIALIIVIAAAGVSIPISLAVALGAVVLWVFFAESLGRAYTARVVFSAPRPCAGVRQARLSKSRTSSSST